MTIQITFPEGDEKIYKICEGLLARIADHYGNASRDIFTLVSVFGHVQVKDSLHNLTFTDLDAVEMLAGCLKEGVYIKTGQ